MTVTVARLLVFAATLLRAGAVGVPECTVRQWKSRHRLNPAARIHGRPLFTAEAVLAADEHARTTPGGRHRKDAG